MSRPAAKRKPGAMPADIAARIRAIGPVIDPQATAAIYAPLHAAEPYAGVTIERDIKYGPDARHALDVIAPVQFTGALPVFVFFHGGGYTGGHKREGSNFFYDNIMLWAAANNVVGVNATYRLAPAHGWPAGAEDVAAVTRWVRAHIADHGGNPDRIFLAGHSAGATHAATYAAMNEFHPSDGAGLAGLILLSGNYDLTQAPADERYAAYFGVDQNRYAERSPFTRLLDIDLPIFAAYGELEPPFLFRQSKQLIAALTEAGRPPRWMLLPGHSHISITYSINTDDTELSDALLAFILAH
jgi:triacylglycerol lipase